jgi:hypothetical protein
VLSRAPGWSEEAAGHRRARVGTASWGDSDLLNGHYATRGRVAVLVNQESLSVGT